ncbi:hypothetical protein J1605_018940 [Eschrichtius robustus]|uniref:PDZ domain-containing protein n=1 Tax=Eschrichtius robustus TaxID=9764 RepID=A0AB34HSB1_ESCRO|nr:hypothetical protein J1605_018940 [Eschrichtius robustus]
MNCGPDAKLVQQTPLSVFLTHSFSSRAKDAAADGPPGIPTQTIIPVKHTVKIDKDDLLQDYGFHISETLPLTVVAVTAGGSAHGKLLPGDQILQMNNEPAEDLSCERAVDILRY